MFITLRYPVVLKVVSRVPAGVNLNKVMLLKFRVPTATILPAESTVPSAILKEPFEGGKYVMIPPEPKDVSRLPSKL